jgi:hypothetical protein
MFKCLSTYKFAMGSNNIIRRIKKTKTFVKTLYFIKQTLYKNMKKIIIVITILLTSNLFIKAQWGPKIKLELKNDGIQTSKLFLGVDTQATDGWDKDIIFNFKDSTIDTTLSEDVDLPPAPMYQMYCRLVKDSNQATASYSYVDFRSIPTNTDIFFHKYWLNIVWYSETAFPKVYIKWGKLPNGIDSAKIHCREWMDDNLYINMQDVEGIELDNEAYKNCFIHIWYNKEHSGIEEPKLLDIVLYPNPTDNFINLYNENYDNYSIINSIGTEFINSKLKLVANNKIDIQGIPSGAYSIILTNKYGANERISFIKK